VELNDLYVIIGELYVQFRTQKEVVSDQQEEITSLRSQMAQLTDAMHNQVERAEEHHE
jgi:hypothetical protein